MLCFFTTMLGLCLFSLDIKFQLKLQMRLRLYGSHHWSLFVIHLQIAMIGHIRLANPQEMERGGVFAPLAIDGMAQC